eukprot:TRINITY_DN66403_c2_g1_i1.p1 TRINITY_DN66403_c2_g1~~TRINITY_DN66403_c2_g1_i1.p1  ORF type:complete len:554 (-),score=267.31 TRINITY_DN66403_c2_g1_i1:1533-3194(-)
MMLMTSEQLSLPVFFVQDSNTVCTEFVAGPPEVRKTALHCIALKRDEKESLRGCACPHCMLVAGSVAEILRVAHVEHGDQSLDAALSRRAWPVVRKDIELHPAECSVNRVLSCFSGETIGSRIMDIDQPDSECLQELEYSCGDLMMHMMLDWSMKSEGSFRQLGPRYGAEATSAGASQHAFVLVNKSIKVQLTLHVYAMEQKKERVKLLKKTNSIHIKVLRRKYDNALMSGLALRGNNPGVNFKAEISARVLRNWPERRLMGATQIVSLTCPQSMPLSQLFGLNEAAGRSAASFMNELSFGPIRRAKNSRSRALTEVLNVVDQAKECANNLREWEQQNINGQSDIEDTRNAFLNLGNWQRCLGEVNEYIQLYGNDLVDDSTTMRQFVATEHERLTQFFQTMREAIKLEAVAHLLRDDECKADDGSDDEDSDDDEGQEEDEDEDDDDEVNKELPPPMSPSDAIIGKRVSGGKRKRMSDSDDDDDELDSSSSDANEHRAKRQRHYPNQEEGEEEEEATLVSVIDDSDSLPTFFYQCGRTDRYEHVLSSVAYLHAG